MVYLKIIKVIKYAVMGVILLAVYTLIVTSL